MIVTPNLNGTSRGELVEQRMKAYRVLMAAVRVLRENSPHPRDYQLAKNPSGAYDEDRARWDYVENAMYDFAVALSDEAVEIQKGATARG